MPPLLRSQNTLPALRNLSTAIDSSILGTTRWSTHETCGFQNLQKQDQTEVWSYKSCNKFWQMVLSLFQREEHNSVLYPGQGSLPNRSSHHSWPFTSKTQKRWKITPQRDSANLDNSLCLLFVSLSGHVARIVQNPTWPPPRLEHQGLIHEGTWSLRSLPISDS